MYFLSIDQGTTSSRAILYDKNFKALAVGQQEFPQHFPEASWVEHNLEEIWDSVRFSVLECFSRAPSGTAREVTAIGITNQRETFGLWNRISGKPAAPAIVWQCKRSAEICQKLKKTAAGKKIESLTGLVLDPYFSGTKVKWLFDRNPALKKAAKMGDLAFGTIDTFLIWRLTGGQSHKTDVSNASRTLLMNLRKVQWDSHCLKTLSIPENILPEICDSNAPFGHTLGLDFLPDGIPITGVLGDQQAALFGQACFHAGQAKCTFGTGAFLLSNTGGKVEKRKGALSTAAWRISGKMTYALEGSVFIAGAAVQWLRDGLRFFKQSADIESLSKDADRTSDVFFIPALSGLGSPHWCPEARGLIGGLTRSTGIAEICKATLEGVAHSVSDLATLIAGKGGSSMLLKILRVDGGASKNDELMQLQADFLGIAVERAQDLETTARGAAMMAALGVGAIGSVERLEMPIERKFLAKMKNSDRSRIRGRWLKRVEFLKKLSKI